MAQNDEKAVAALLVGEYKSDRSLVSEIFRRAGWRLFEARDRSHALHCLEANPVQVVIAESDLPHWSWKNVLRDLRRMTHPPQLVVASRTADDRLWAEVLNIGGYDVLAQPFDSDEVSRVIAAARRHFEAQRKSAALALPAPAYSAA